jgi:hypothetical protein
VRNVQAHPQDYQAAWAQLRDHAASLGIRAWMFRSAHDASRYVEFLEWKQPDQKPKLNAALKAQCAGLDRFGTATSTDYWLEP